MYNLIPGTTAIKESDLPLIHTLICDNKTLEEIRKVLKIAWKPLSNFWKYNNLPNARRRRHDIDMANESDMDKILTKEYLLNCISLGMRRIDIANAHKTSIDTVKRALSNHGILICPKPKAFREKLMEDKQKIIDLYEANQSIREISEIYGCASDTISKFFKKIGYSYRKINMEDLSPYKEDIVDLYFNKAKPMGYIGKLYNCSWVKIRRFLRSSGYTIRTKKEIMRDNPYNTDFSNGKYSMSKRKSYILPSGKEIRLQGYEPQFLDHVFNHNIYKEDEIDYKPKRLRYVFNGNKYYYPDFYIPKHNMLVEIKSSWILKLQGEAQCMAKLEAAKKSGITVCMILDNNFEEFDSLVNNTCNNHSKADI